VSSIAIRTTGLSPGKRFNHSVFGGTYYLSSLLHLMRAGVDQEMFWTGTEDKGGYSMMGKHGEPRPAYYAKRLCTDSIRHRLIASVSPPANE